MSIEKSLTSRKGVRSVVIRKDLSIGEKIIYSILIMQGFSVAIL